MMSDIFCCPVCKGPLRSTSKGFQCRLCERSYPIRNGIPDFYISESEHDFSVDPNIIWLDPQVVEARDTIYSHCSRALKGMIFCMHEIGRRTSRGCRVLEVGMGTGHFTQWLAEVSEPGTSIYAFDFSWPIIEEAQAKTAGLTDVTLFRANSREGLPFQRAIFDIILVRLAPLGLSGVPSVQAGFELLKPGGWYFSAGWKNERFETSPTEFAFQHGYESAEYHEWQYRRMQHEEERVAWQYEQEYLLPMLKRKYADDTSERTRSDLDDAQDRDGQILKMTHEHVLIAHKSAAQE